MPLKDLLRKKEKVSHDDTEHVASPVEIPEFTFMRTDTNTQEIIQPPTYEGDNDIHSPHKRHSRFRKLSNASSTNNTSTSPSPSGEKRLSQRLHLTSKSRSTSTSSVNLPADLPTIVDEPADAQEREARWEERATMLAQGNPNTRPQTPTEELKNMQLGNTGRPMSVSGSGRIVDASGDENIQEAIRLHESGDLVRSTDMFGRLADPEGENNALSQVLFGLALRHGWGCKPDPGRAVSYLSAAASNSAAIERDALKAGMKKGGAAKGELVLAIFELANCFRHGWGVEKDAMAARQYYETAANLGDTDAMNEAAWCYLEGFGGKKDKLVAAKYYRLAEEKGNKTLGNTWIWKDKYNPK